MSIQTVTLILQVAVILIPIAVGIVTYKLCNDLAADAPSPETSRDEPPGVPERSQASFRN